MTVIEMGELFGLRSSSSAGLSHDRFLQADDLLSYGEDGLGLDVDAQGRLVLDEGREAPDAPA
jgi:hypothetical protein